MTDGVNTSALKLWRIERHVRDRIRVLSENVEALEPYLTGEVGRTGLAHMRGSLSAYQDIILQYFLTADEHAEIEKTRREMFG